MESVVIDFIIKVFIKHDTDACSVVAEMDKTSSVKVQLAVLNLLVVNVLCTNSKSFSDEAVLLKVINGFCVLQLCLLQHWTPQGLPAQMKRLYLHVQYLMIMCKPLCGT